VTLQRPVVPYVGRFAPSPTGPLHAGSLVAALASWLDARAHGGRWLVRIEDIDTLRCVPAMDQVILSQLAACGLRSDEPPLWQSSRDRHYAAASETLLDRGSAYPCGCTRREIEDTLLAHGAGHERHQERVYPGTCRDGLHGKPPRAVRVRTLSNGDDLVVHWNDRRLGKQQQNLTQQVGDFVLQRADGLWAYQLAVVVDDAAQAVTHVVRGADLADNTPRQMHLQDLLGLPTPVYLHTPVVLGNDGEKLAKGNGAVAIDPGPAAVLAALMALELRVEGQALGDLLAGAVASWRDRWGAR
jgi:glutamyl-Q tRNA(Asp) synthetase